MYYSGFDNLSDLTSLEQLATGYLGNGEEKKPSVVSASISEAGKQMQELVKLYGEYTLAKQKGKLRPPGEIKVLPPKVEITLPEIQQQDTTRRNWMMGLSIAGVVGVGAILFFVLSRRK